MVLWVAWGAVAGGAALLVQLPSVLSCRASARLLVKARRSRAVLKFFPASITRGVTQIGAFVDGITRPSCMDAIAAVADAVLRWRGESWACRSGGPGSTAVRRRYRRGRHTALRAKLEDRSGGSSWCPRWSRSPPRRGVAALFFQSGLFTAADSRYVWLILAGSSIGLLATTQGAAL